MLWIKKGLIYSPENNHDWMQTHAQIPTPYMINNCKLRIYFNVRDEQNRSLPTYIEVKPDVPTDILYKHTAPLLNLGAAGTFDDNGVMISSVIKTKNKVFLYYTGWNKGCNVSYRLAIGLAISRDNGRTFKKYSTGPILERSIHDPIFVAAPCVLYENNIFKMWYISCTNWKYVYRKNEPVYLIKYAESKNGINWSIKGVSIRYKYDGEALGRPFVINEKGSYKMWYSSRGSINYRKATGQHYKIGYAESMNGLKWTRKDNLMRMDVSNGHWDSDMTAYCCVYTANKTKYMLYNGNGFGKSGFGYAVLEQ